MAPRDQTIYTVYPLQNYSFGTKDRKMDKDKDIESRLARLKASFEAKGMRRSVEAIIIVQEHNHPHVLLLQVRQDFFKLPGGRLKVDEDEIDGLKRKLTTALSPINPALQTAWDVGECAGIFWRPNFDIIFYPYVPSHITRPKECKKLFVVPLPDKAMFAVPRNMRLVAVPLYELYDNVARYGPVIASLPLCLSRYRLNLIRNATVPGPVPPAAPPATKPATAGSTDHQAEEQKHLKVETMVA